MKLFLEILIGFFVIVWAIRSLEHTVSFAPKRAINVSPAQRSIPFEDVIFQSTKGISLHGWFIKGKSSTTILYVHGNAGNIGDRLDKLDFFYRLGLNIFIFDYRGYGKSSGHPSENGIYQDAQAAYDYLLTRKDVVPEKIVFYGASLGGAVAIDLALHRNPAAVILDSTFTSAADMAKRIYPFIPSVIIKSKFDSMSKISKIGAPKLFIHSPTDEVVPYALGRRLFDAAVGQKEFKDVQGGHNDAHMLDQDVFISVVGNFLKKNNLLE